MALTKHWMFEKSAVNLKSFAWQSINSVFIQKQAKSGEQTVLESPPKPCSATTGSSCALTVPTKQVGAWRTSWCAKADTNFKC